MCAFSSLVFFYSFFLFFFLWLDLLLFLGGGGWVLLQPFCTQSCCWLGRFHQLELDSYVLVLYYNLKFDGIIRCLDFHCLISRWSSSDD